MSLRSLVVAESLHLGKIRDDFMEDWTFEWSIEERPFKVFPLEEVF